MHSVLNTTLFKASDAKRNTRVTSWLQRGKKTMSFENDYWELKRISLRESRSMKWCKLYSTWSQHLKRGVKDEHLRGCCFSLRMCFLKPELLWWPRSFTSLEGTAVFKQMISTQLGCKETLNGWLQRGASI